VSAPFAQQIRFCTSCDGVRIAYATVGGGPPLVKAANWLSHLEFDSHSPVWRHWIRELSRNHTLVRYDERGCGLSDWAVEEFSLDAWVRDLEAVVDAQELERFPLLGISQGGPIAIAYAARHPERVSQLILYGSYARGFSHRNLPDREREEGEMMLRMIRVGWGRDHAVFRQVFTSLFLPDGTPEQAHWFNELERVSATPENAARVLDACYSLDVRALAPGLDTPTLVLHGNGDLRVPFEEGRLLAALIPGARFVPLDSRNHILLESEPAWPRFLREVREFLGVEEPRPAASVAGTPSTPSAAGRQRLEAVFDEAIELAPADRPAFLSRACADDAECRREVELMVQLAEQSGLTAKLAGAVAGLGVSRVAVTPGQTLSQYEIVEQLGGGGMGVVYKALDRRLHRFVALKFLPPYLSAEKGLKLRFLQEAKAIASLDHPNICAVLEVEELEDGQLFMVMPCYEGETLKQKIARGPLGVEQALDYASQIAAGLAHAHAAGVVHRDVKPANLVVTADERVKILDFGVAKVADVSLTRTGAVLGTPRYMSPEQACGDPVDHRTDLWALGAVLYEMLTGTPPFQASTPEALYFVIQHRDPSSIRALRPEVPPALEAIVHRLLEKDPFRRYGGAREVAAELEGLGLQAAGSSSSAGEAVRRSDAGSLRSHGHLVARGADPAPVAGADHLERARAAFARTAWREAYDGLSTADAAGRLEAEDLERLAEAAWWLSNGTACVRARERAYRQYVQQGERRAAASVALVLAEDHFHRLARSVGQGWLRRAERHLEGLADVSERGWLYRLRLVIALEAERKPEEAMEYADRALEIARRVGDTDLEALALQDRGRVLVALGRVNEGMALIDEAMAAATAGELTPRTTGRVYCNMLSTCARLGDVGRAAEWYDAAQNWCEPHADSGYPGVCRVYRAGILRLRGSLREAEHEARRAVGELADFLADVAGEAFYELGEIRLRTGDLPGADKMFSEAHARGRDPQPGLASLRLAEGRPEPARSMIERALLEPGLTALDRAKLLPALVEIRLACGEIAAAGEGVSELETITTTCTSPALVASAALARGRVELAGGQAEQAMVHLRRACRIWAEIDLPIELAQTRLLLSRAYSALGNADEAELEERAAQAAMERIGSRALRRE
jgi:pimeloyl-ACP methyl ester carboxylesterase/tetratricopeptide (TPR) repeat protein